MSDCTWLLDLVTWCVNDSREDVHNWIAWAERQGELTPEALASRVAAQQARLASRAPVTAAMAANLPGVRNGVDSGRIAPEAGFLVYRQIKAILYQAAAYRQNLSDPELLPRVLLILGVVYAHQKTRASLVDEACLPPSRVIGAIMEGGISAYAAVVAETVEARFAGRRGLDTRARVARPFFGAQNFTLVSAASLAGRYVFNDAVLSADELHALDTRILDLGRTVLGLMVWMARADGHFDSSEQAVIRSLTRAFVVPGVTLWDREANQDMTGSPDWDRVRGLFQTDDEKAGLLENVLQVVWADGEKVPAEDRLCRRLAAELAAERMMDEIEMEVRQNLARKAGAS